jgi:hypothetical protein
LQCKFLRQPKYLGKVPDICCCVRHRTESVRATL